MYYDLYIIQCVLLQQILGSVLHVKGKYTAYCTYFLLNILNYKYTFFFCFINTNLNLTAVVMKDVYSNLFKVHFSSSDQCL